MPCPGICATNGHPCSKLQFPRLVSAALCTLLFEVRGAQCCAAACIPPARRLCPPIRGFKGDTEQRAPVHSQALLSMFRLLLGMRWSHREKGPGLPVWRGLHCADTGFGCGVEWMKALHLQVAAAVHLRGLKTELPVWTGGRKGGHKHCRRGNGSITGWWLGSQLRLQICGQAVVYMLVFLVLLRRWFDRLLMGHQWVLAPPRCSTLLAGVDRQAVRCVCV